MANIEGNRRKNVLPADPLSRTVIVVETDDFAVYHAIVSELKSRDATFTTVAPGKPRPEAGLVVITDPDHDIGDIDRPVIRTTPDRARAAVEEAFTMILDRSPSQRIVGVDPGDHPGIAVLQDELIVAAYQVPFPDAVDQIRAEIAKSTDVLVRIGDGSRLQGAAIINELQGPDRARRRTWDDTYTWNRSTGDG